MTLHQTHLIRKILAIAMVFGGIMTCLPLARAAGSVTVGGPFTLTAPDGSNVTDQTFRGRWMLIYFGYTSCPNTCPVALTEMAAALKKLGPEADKLQVIFITLDPERDTPKVMGEYVQSFDPRIIGLTGSESEIDAVAHAYGAYYVRHSSGPDAQDYLVDHSIYIYLISPQGKFVCAFDINASGDDIAAAMRDQIDTQSLRGELVRHAAQ